MKLTIKRVVELLGVICSVGTFVSWATNNKIALYVSLLLLILTIVYLLVYYLVERFIHPLKMEICKPITHDIWISSHRNNRQSIDNTFLTWNECTILLWLLVPRRGEGLRNAPHNKYIIAHQTGEKNNSRHFNALFLRYSSHNTWDFIFSNPRGEIPPDNDQFRFNDGLEPGWHQIQITWNNSKPLLKFLVDGGDRINFHHKSYLDYWPREQANSVYIGAWVNPYPESYCETKLSQLWICNKELEPTNSLVQEHRKLHYR
jgi:hypothetical protein